MVAKGTLCCMSVGVQEACTGKAKWIFGGWGWI